MIASNASSSALKTRAGPECFSMAGATALRFTTAPSGARLPRRTARPPVADQGSSTGRITAVFLFSAFFTASSRIP